MPERFTVLSPSLKARSMANAHIETPLEAPLPQTAPSPISDRSRICPACSRATIHVLCFRKNGSDILQCTGCGLGRAETSAFDPSTYYTADYFSGGHADGYSDYRGAEAVLRREFAGTVEFIRGFRTGGKLLEIGCAYGFFLHEASRYFEVAGIELADDAAAQCRHEGLHVLPGVADEANLEQIGSVDVIVMLDVIEHLPQPGEVLDLCSRHLNPGGLIVLTTGDFASIVAKVSGPKWRLMTPPQHLWYFTPESIRRMSAALGLSVEHLGHPWKAVPASLILFQLRRMFGVGSTPITAGSSIGVPVNLFDAMRVVLRKPS
jgi:SAM-dependent methyltransferase